MQGDKNRRDVNTAIAHLVEQFLSTEWVTGSTPVGDTGREAIIIKRASRKTKGRKVHLRQVVQDVDFRVRSKCPGASLVSRQSGASQASPVGGIMESVMKIVEAMKRVKSNKEKITDLVTRIGQVSAHLSHETPVYGAETASKITEWAQSCNDLTQENVRLLVAISRTNLATMATITLGDHSVTKSLAEWIWRRREYAALDMKVWGAMTDRNLKEGQMQSTTGIPFDVKIVRNYDPNLRDKRVAEFKSEPHEIDSTLEVINAVTDLVE
jgi:hypothetical protein